MASYIERHFGFAVKPAVVSIALASFREKEARERSALMAKELLAQVEAEKRPKRQRKGASKEGGSAPA
jgi:hypothetical protein